jgi:hypothetical protein
MQELLVQYVQRSLYSTAYTEELQGTTYPGKQYRVKEGDYCRTSSRLSHLLQLERVKRQESSTDGRRQMERRSGPLNGTQA